MRFEQIVIVGAGQSAAQAVDTLRRNGFRGKLALIGEEPWLPYQRPPLSKKYLAGALTRGRLSIRAPQFYEQHSVETHLGARVEQISRPKQRVWLSDGSELPYDALLLATGSRPRRPPIPGIELQGVHTLSRMCDAELIRSQLASAKRLLIIGGGYIGLEVAATARELGLDVSVLELAPRLMSRVTCPFVSAFYAREHARRGTRILCSCKVQAIAGDPSGRVRAVVTGDGEEHPADLVIVAVGAVPADELAAAAGLECAGGIVVDEHCRTVDPSVYAAGDCANHPSLHYRRRVRLESVDNAFEQGTTAGLNLLGLTRPHDKVPWFWSDQYDLKLMIAGLAAGHDEVLIRGSPDTGRFSACYLRDGELIAVDSVNSPKEQMAARRLIAAHARPRRERLADPAVPLKDCL
jgi:3-phenylpropionate/trans-cinnamate dioxygenase ferredoxin reductase subunit